MNAFADPVCRALLADCRANPADDTPLSILADWLEDYGDESDRARADFIRLTLRERRSMLPKATAVLKKHRYKWLRPLVATTQDLLDTELRPNGRVVRVKRPLYGRVGSHWASLRYSRGFARLVEGYSLANIAPLLAPIARAEPLASFVARDWDMRTERDKRVWEVYASGGELSVRFVRILDWKFAIRGASAGAWISFSIRDGESEIDANRRVRALLNDALTRLAFELAAEEEATP